jgi:hypothetical protein
MMVVAPRGFGNAGEQMYHFVPGIFDEPGFHTCNDGCPYSDLIGKGDCSRLLITGRHEIAERTRASRAINRRALSWGDRFWEFLDNFISSRTR